MSELDINLVCAVDVYLVRNSAGRVGGDPGSLYTLEFQIDTLSFRAISSFLVSATVTMCTDIHRLKLILYPPGKILPWSDYLF